jgi:hypothetical protein
MMNKRVESNVKQVIHLYDDPPAQPAHDNNESLESRTAQPAPAQECLVCNGMGFIDGVGAKCRRCNGRGLTLATTPPAAPAQAQENAGAITQVFTGLPLRKLRTLLDEGWAFNGLSIERKGADGNVRRGAITLGGMVLWWHEAEGAAPCTWTKSPDPCMPDTFNATCGVVWTFTDGGPAENDVRFCPGCGAAVSVADPEPEEDLFDLAVKADNGGQP